MALQENRLWEMEQLCRGKALESFRRFMLPGGRKKIFLNVNPSIMHDDKFREGFTRGFLKAYGMTPDDVIFEITEKNRVADVNGFQDSIAHYRNQNYKIAIDDVGAGYSGLNLISEINPDYIKLDMQLIRNIHLDKLKHSLVQAMVELSNVANIALIAEGIECREELESLLHVGVQYGQGFYIQKPEEEIYEIKEDIVDLILEANFQGEAENQSASSGISIRDLCRSIKVVSPSEQVSDVYQIFKEDPECFGLCVVEDQKAVGIVTRGRLALRLSGQYGFSLNQKKNISEIMERTFLSVGGEMTMKDVCAIAMARSHEMLYDFIVITENNRFCGVVTIKDLLEKKIEIEVSQAKDQNPLTGLPGNKTIEKELNKCIGGDEEYTVAYIDIDNFKAYNDVYGFENGDKVLRMLGKIIRQTISEKEFVGHIGGDDFVVIGKKHLPEILFRSISTRFEREVFSFYNREDQNSGYIVTANRNGEKEAYPLMSLTIAHVDESWEENRSGQDLSTVLAGMKCNQKKAKRERQIHLVKIS